MGGKRGRKRIRRGGGGQGREEEWKKENNEEKIIKSVRKFNKTDNYKKVKEMQIKSRNK